MANKLSMMLMFVLVFVGYSSTLINARSLSSQLLNFEMLPKGVPIPPSGPSTRTSADVPPPPPSLNFEMLPKGVPIPPSGPSTRTSADVPPPPSLNFEMLPKGVPIPPSGPSTRTSADVPPPPMLAWSHNIIDCL
ncbi:hypothetical protein COLO4_29051 [Corchorus olitorius]|uniref:Hydroxyproline-rich glycoprotein family protein n=1 Tax=Corchorus olitorius TaxID=93759 RepID=A0A1R3HGL7_9ROSI|nr:hypothetical protein COLO4_29051 [Corchorus olitorius]